MERSEILDMPTPDFAALHPGYSPSRAKARAPNDHARRNGAYQVRAAALRRGRNTTKCDMEKLTAKAVRMAQPLAGRTGMNCAATTSAVVFAMTPRITEATNVA